MERKIGEIFEYNGEWYQCVIGCHCNDCAFHEKGCKAKLEVVTLQGKIGRRLFSKNLKR